MSPYREPRLRPVHMAHLINKEGGVTGLCFTGRRPIDMQRASWTTMARAVTCAKCLRLL